MRFFVLLVIVLAVVLGCHDDCDPEATRCNGNKAEVCNSKTDWEVMSDCDEASEDTPFIFECQHDEEAGQHLCVPTNLPVGDGGDGG